MESAAELRVRLCRPAAEMVLVVLAVVAMEVKLGDGYTQPRMGLVKNPTRSEP